MTLKLNLKRITSSKSSNNLQFWRRQWTKVLVRRLQSLSQWWILFNSLNKILGLPLSPPPPILHWFLTNHHQWPHLRVSLAQILLRLLPTSQVTHQLYKLHLMWHLSPQTKKNDTVSELQKARQRIGISPITKNELHFFCGVCNIDVNKVNDSELSGSRQPLTTFKTGSVLIQIVLKSVSVKWPETSLLVSCG